MQLFVQPEQLPWLHGHGLSFQTQTYASWRISVTLRDVIFPFPSAPDSPFPTAPDSHFSTAPDSHWKGESGAVTILRFVPTPTPTAVSDKYFRRPHHSYYAAMICQVNKASLALDS